MLKQQNVNPINELASCWQLYQVRPNGMEYKENIEIAENWLNNSFNLPQSTQKKILNYLLDNFNNTQFYNLTEKGKAGLCLRCYISEHIVKACKKRASLFISQGVTYQALLPFVLDDNGKSLIILDQEGKQQLEITESETFKPTNNDVFTVEILRSYDHQRDKKCSLINWTYLRTKQNQKIVDFLSEFGFYNSTDWSLLTRIKKYQLKRLTEQEQLIIKVYGEVYKRDRRQNKDILRSKCQPPSDEQLQEMIDKLKNKIIKKPDDLLKKLKCIAKQMRKNVVSLDSNWVDKEVEINTIEITYDDVAIEDQERIEIGNEISKYINDNLIQYCQINLEKEIKKQIEKLMKSKKYSPYASQYIPILKVFYQGQKSLSDIAKDLGIEQYKASRIFSPKNLLKEVRKKTIDDLVNSILKLVKEKKLISEPLDNNYLTLLTETVETFADQKIFSEASAEIMNSKNKKIESFYAKTLMDYLVQNS
jgi:hypothetical protein